MKGFCGMLGYRQAYLEFDLCWYGFRVLVCYLGMIIACDKCMNEVKGG